MRLDYALVSSLLFVSAVLAEPPQRPCLDASLIDDLAIDTPWAGRVWCTDDQEEYVSYVGATFVVPTANLRDVPGLGFDIIIGISGHKSPYEGVFQVAVGITVTISELSEGGPRVIVYKPWAKFYNSDTVEPDPCEFRVSSGDVITAGIQFIKTTTAYVFLQHDSVPQGGGELRWGEFLDGEVLFQRNRDAEWIIQAFPHLSLPNFYQLQFMNIDARFFRNGGRTPDPREKPIQNTYSVDIRQGHVWKTDVELNPLSPPALVVIKYETSYARSDSDL